MMFSHIDLIRSRRTHVSLVGRSSPKAAIGQFPLGSLPWLRGWRRALEGPQLCQPKVHQNVQWFQMFHGCCGFVDYEKAGLVSQVQFLLGWTELEHRSQQLTWAIMSCYDPLLSFRSHVCWIWLGCLLSHTYDIIIVAYVCIYIYIYMYTVCIYILICRYIG